MVINHDFFMSLALKEAWKYQGLTYPNPAVGCCIVGEHNEILAVAAHKKAGLPHAEVEALKIAYKILTNDTQIDSLQSSQEIHTYLLENHNNLFHNTKLYTTLEPCSHVGKTPSCASLIMALGIKEVYVGSKDTNPLASGGNDKLMACGIDVKESLLQEACDALVEPFFLWNTERFVFFKWAQRLNGTFDSGTISSLASRKHVHAMRDRCDLLVIGGNTVRVDRPTLDARLVDGKAPDVLILSHQKDFDQTIPLFHVEGRDVYIEDSLERIKEYKHIMIEGGDGMFASCKDVVDRYLCYIAPTFGGHKTMQNQESKFEILNLQQVAQDIIMWMKRI
jgi:diaminohydroxyphosphoribosylaminopyrimidine deaminase/5-amino-6-(5-phosphoribosylamino)uracil reductase